MDGRPVPMGNLHLTLLFLGNVETDRIDAVCDITARIVGHQFDLLLDTFGSFRQGNTRILWLAPSESPPELGALHQSLCQQVEGIGLRTKKETYRPHVTLIRKASPRKRIPEKLDPGILWRVRHFALVASKPLPAGSRYRTLAEKKFPELT